MNESRIYQHREQEYILQWNESQITIIHPGGETHFKKFNANTRPYVQELDVRENLHHRYFGPEGYSLKTSVNPSPGPNQTTFDIGITTPAISRELKDVPQELFRDIKDLLSIPRLF